MPHPCRNHWMLSQSNLTASLIHAEGTQIVGGWAYLLVDGSIAPGTAGADADFQALVDAHRELGLALEQPTVAPGLWFDPRTLPPNDPRLGGRAPIDTSVDPLLDFATLAPAFLSDLRRDGNEMGQAGPCHAEYGMRGWIRMGVSDPLSLQIAGNLLLRIQNALDR